MKHSFKLVALCLYAVLGLLIQGCGPETRITGLVLDNQTGTAVPGTAVLGIVWIEDADKALPTPDTKNLKSEDRDTVLDKDTKDRGLPMAYARTFADNDGKFELANFQFSAATKKAVKAMKQPKITRVTMWAFQKGYRKQAVTMFPKQPGKAMPSASMLLARPADWKELYLDNLVNTLTQDYMVKGYSKEFGATEQEKIWLLEYTHSNLWKAYADSDIKGDKEMEEMCGRDYSDLIVSTAGIQRNPGKERCAELIRRVGAVREIEELWITHIRKNENPIGVAKGVVRRGLAQLPAEASEPREYEAMILAGLEDAVNAKNKGAMRNGLAGSWQEEAALQYGKGDKAAAYRALGYAVYNQLPKEIQEGVITAQLSVRTIPGIKETAAGFYLLMNRPQMAQLPGGDDGNHKDKPGFKVENSTETIDTNNVPIEEYVPKVILEGKWGNEPGEFGMASRFPLGLYDQYTPSSLTVDTNGNIYVLDFVNNRIQKFTKDGGYITSLSIDGLKGELSGYCIDDTCYEVSPAAGVKYDRPVIGKVEVIGINIVTDSKDTLYYYLKRFKNSEVTGEVWEFKGDKLLKKTVVPVDGGVYYEAPLGLSLEEDDSIWIFNAQENGVKTNKHYEIQGKKKYTTKERNEKLAKARGIHKEQKSTNTTPLDKLWELDLQITERGIRVVRNRHRK